MAKIYRADGSTIDLVSTISYSCKDKKPHGKITNIVQTHKYTDPGNVNWMRSGIRFRRTKEWITSFTFNYSINLDGNATAFYVNCKGTVDITVQHTDYAGGEQSYSDAFSDSAKLNAEYIDFYTVIATTANTTSTNMIANGRVLKLNSIPDGLEFVEEYFGSQCPEFLSVDTIVYDEADTYETILSKWKGLKWFAIGDSITQGRQTAPIWDSYPKICADKLDFSLITNVALGGTKLLQWVNSPTDYFDSISRGNFRGYDLVTIMHGVNDFNNTPVSPIGAIVSGGTNFDKTTFIGAYQYIINKIQEQSPSTKIIIFGSIYTTGGNTPNSLGFTLADYQNAAKTVAEFYELPYLNLGGVITPTNIGTMTYDGIHPTAQGQMLLADAIIDFMVKL